MRVGRAKSRKFKELERIGALDYQNTIDTELFQSAVTTGVAVPKFLARLQINKDAVDSSIQRVAIKAFGLLKLRRALARSISVNRALSWFLPPEWINCLIENGISVRPQTSLLLWRFGAFVYLIFSTVKLLRVITNAARKPSKSGPSNQKPLAAFVALSKNNIDLTLNEDGSVPRNILTWFCKSEFKPKRGDIVEHSVDGTGEKRIFSGVTFVDRSFILPLPSSRSERFTLYLELVSLWFRSMANFFLRSSWYGFAFEEVAYCAWVNRMSSSQLADHYLFHNDSWFYRPLWTYIAERRSSRVWIYFYSSNMLPFSMNGKMLPVGQYADMPWNRYVLWNNDQADFIKLVAKQVDEIILDCPISFSDCKVSTLFDRDRQTIAVFDVMPRRLATTLDTIDGHGFYSEDNAVAFIRNICAYAANLNYKVLLKYKRSDVTHGSRRYQNLVDQLRERGQLELVHPDISAERLIEKVDIVISMPFTTTGLIAQKMNKPSVYFDPTGKIDCEGTWLGVDVLQGNSELEQFLVTGKR